jgi:hypothetical protein
MSLPSNEEQRVWKYLLSNKLAEAGDVAINCDVSLEFAQHCIDRVGTPREVFVEEAKSAQQEWDDETIALHAQLREDEMSQKRQVKPTRVQTLETAIKLTGGDRNKSYGPPFDNLSDCAELWNAYINSKSDCIEATADGSYTVRLKAEDVAWLNVLQKMARSFKSGYHPDNYTDAAAYSAIAGECREIQLEEDVK